jgi:hypothetical protein
MFDAEVSVWTLGTEQSYDAPVWTLGTEFRFQLFSTNQNSPRDETVGPFRKSVVDF